MSALCKRCGGFMSFDDGTGEHMLCEPSVAVDFARADKRRREGRKLADQGMAAALRNNPDAKRLGLQIIETAARRLEFLSADDVRNDFLANRIPTSCNGGIWQAAARSGLVTKVASHDSAGKSAHGKPIDHYRSLMYRKQAS